jgi:SnoaL-like domain
MKIVKATVVSLLGLYFAPHAFGASGAELTVPIHQFIDGFNSGNVKSAFAAYAAGDITIVDEFAPHRWTGPKAAQAWAAEYDRHAQATGISDGIVKYGEPTRSEVEGDVAYVIVPTVYNYKQHGQATSEEGQMTFVLHQGRGVWKIRSWTWSGVPPHPAN